ncbi:hypothetical protein JTE90_029003 [Oedothorax gibbosus]|uniref:Uncharacterized protein n=1 Tax=Oedothorax gibbosus TaxID=931172 RepID=A0AAV6VIS7_9ARAC|nr:hypothetical protein JTE90_029003 [Oedothorax gibbosus]
MPVWNKPPSHQIALLTNPDVPAEQKPNRDTVIQLLSKANEILNLHKNFFREHDPTTPGSHQIYIDWIKIQEATLNYLSPLTAEEHINAYGHPHTFADDRQSAGAELTCPAVQPSDGCQTTKPHPPQNGISANELLDNPLHPDSSAPSIGDISIFTLPSTSSAMEVNDGFITPSIRKTNNRKTSDINSPSLVHPNKFQHLNHETSLEEVNPSKKMEGNFTQTNARSARIPPLIITNPQFQWTEIRKKLLITLGEERADSPKCANCGGLHVASFRLCRSRPQPKDAPQGPARPNAAAPPPPPAFSMENFPQSSNAPPPPPTWTPVGGHRQLPATSHQAPPAGAPPTSAPPPTSNPGPRPNSTTPDNHTSFDFRTLFFKLHNLWQKFKTSNDIVSKMEIGFEAITELFNLFNHE